MRIYSLHLGCEYICWKEETYLKSEEIISFYPQFSCICRLFYNTSNYVEPNYKFEEITSVYPIFYALRDFNCNSVESKYPSLIDVY